MDFELSLNIRNAEDVAAEIRALPAKVAEKTLRTALDPAAHLMAREVALRARRRSGELETNIGYDTQTGNLADVAFAHVGVLYGGKRAKKARKLKRGRRQSTPSTEDPGVYGPEFVEFGTSYMAPQPFMRPAFESAAQEAVDAFAAALAEELDAKT